MQAGPYVVAQADGCWSIRSSGGTTDRFDDKEDAVLTAVIRAASDERHGLHAQVIVEENGRRRAVWGDDAAQPARRPHPRRAPSH